MEPNKNKSFKAGEVIQDWVKPLIKVLMPDEKSRRCANCFKSPQGSEELKRCGACKINHYCSKSCQKEDWDYAHSVECKSPLTRRPVTMFGKISSYADSNWNPVVARVLAHFKLHPADEVKEHEVYDGTLRSVSTLMAHVDSGERPFDRLAQKMSDLVIHKDSKWRPEYIRKIVGIWKTNSFELMESGKKIGAGLFVEPSVFDHSCRPTAICVIDEMNGWRSQVRALVDIPSGDQPLITYLPGLMNRAERQIMLKEFYYFQCRCNLCEQEKGGAAANYELLKEFEEKCDMILAGEARQEGATVESIISLRDKVLHHYGQLYHPFDEPITVVASRVLLFLLKHDSGLLRVGSAESLPKLASDTLKRLKVTYGTEHGVYKMFEARLRDRGILAFKSLTFE